MGFTGGLIAGLAARIPHKIAMEMILLCRNVDAQRGYNVGLCNEVVPIGKQVDVALGMAREMTEFSPLVLKTLKRFVTETVLPQGPSEQSGRAQRSLVAVRENEDCGRGDRRGEGKAQAEVQVLVRTNNVEVHSHIQFRRQSPFHPVRRPLRNCRNSRARD